MNTRIVALLMLLAGSLILGKYSRTGLEFKWTSQSSVASTPDWVTTLKRVATVPILRTEYRTVANFISPSGDLYLTNLYAGTMSVADWKTNRTGSWVKVGSSTCFPDDFKVQKVYVMKTKPYLLVLSCNQLELLDNRTFLPKNTMPTELGLVASGFDVSPDERYIAISVHTNP